MLHVRSMMVAKRNDRIVINVLFLVYLLQRYTFSRNNKKKIDIF